jgi:septum formation protein
MHQFIYLASQSPRRRQLLEQIGVPYRLLLADDDEDAESLETVRLGETPTAYVRRVTRLKLDAALARMQRRRLGPAPVLCSDTTVALGREILGKPDDPAHARQMLRSLSGRTHRVLTAVQIGLGRRRLEALSESRVSLEMMTPAQVRAYVATGEPMGKAGAYAVQGNIARHISRISGSYSGIMGLPLFETAQLVREMGLKI